MQAPISADGRVVREHLDRPQIAPDYGHVYNGKDRLASYWHQVDEVLSFAPCAVLDIGIGSGFVSTALQQEGVAAYQLDVDPRLGPDVAGSVRALPIAAGSVDVVVCCQVLEHLPFSEFSNTVRELARVARKGCVVSLPDVERYMRVSLSLPGRGAYSILRDLPRRKSRRPTLPHPEHYWEIGCAEVGLSDVLHVFQDVLGAAVRTYRVFENPYHRFFIVTL